MSNLLQRITFFAAGIDENTIAQCSTAEQNKYSVLGTLVFIPLVTGTIGMAFACSYYTRNILVILGVCLVWASLVFVIERGLIAGLRPRTFSLAVPVRFIMAFAMSCIITELLMIFAFKSDIDAKIAETTATQKEMLYRDGNADLDKLRADLQARKDALDAKEKAYLDEIDGLNGTGIHGYGPSAKAKELALAQERAKYQNDKELLEARIAKVSSDLDETVDAMVEAKKDGLLADMTALYALSNEERNIAIALIILHIFFICLETMPMILKLCLPGTQYYEIQDAIDAQQLEAVKTSLDDTKQIMILSNQCKLAQQELEIREKMTRLMFRHTANQAIEEVRELFDTAIKLDEISKKNSSKLSDEHVERLKSEIDAIFERFLETRSLEPSAT